MKWLTLLEKHNIPFTIHILEKDDCFIINHITHKIKVIYLLDGFMQILQVFTNGEKICKQLIYSNSIVQNTNINTNKINTYYYKAVAITKTVVMSVPKKILEKTLKNNNILTQDFQITYRHPNNDIIKILIYKNTKKRVFHLLLILSKHFGKFENNYIVIPFYLSHFMIANITGSQRITINRIMSKLKQDGIINYNHKYIFIYQIVKLIAR